MIAEAIQLITVGLTKGAIYCLLALGMVVIYKTTHVVNLAQGQMAAVGAFVCYFFLNQLGFPIWLSLILTFSVCGLMGWVIERVFFRPMIGQPLMALLMMTVALMYFIRSVIGVAYAGKSFYYEPSIFSTAMMSVGNLAIGKHYFFTVGAVIILLVVFFLFFKYSPLGLSMRATAEDHQISRSLGVNVKRVFSMSWVIGGLVGAAAGVMFANIFQVTYLLGELGLKALPVILLGGLESIPGCIIGGLLIGLTETWSAHYLDPITGGGFAEVAPYIVMLIFLMFLPYGLLGEKRIERI